jgi:hypothetical protein
VRGSAGTTQICKFAGTITWSGQLNLNTNNSTSVIHLTVGPLTTADSIYINNGSSGGTIYFLDAVTMAATKYIWLVRGTLHTDGATDNAGLSHTVGYFSSGTNANTRNLYLGNSTFSVLNSWDINYDANLTIAANTSTINFTSTGTTNLTMNGGKGTYYNVYRTGRASKADTFTVKELAVSNEFKFMGNSATERILIKSTTLGTSASLTLTGATISNCQHIDFRDIGFVSTGVLDFSAIAGYSGDCGGNTISGGGTLTLTVSDTQTWNNANGGNWSGANWTGTVISRVPLPQDDAVMGMAYGTNKTVTADMPRLGKNISWSGATYTTNLTFATNSTANTIYGSLNLTGISIYTSSSSLTFEGRGNYELTTNGKSFANNGFIVAMVGGQLTFMDAFTSTQNVTHSFGTIVINNSWTATKYGSSYSNIRALTITNANITLSAADSATKVGDWNISTNYSLNMVGTASIIFSDTSATVKSFQGGNLAFNDLTIPSGSGGVLIQGSNSFNTITITAGGKLTVTAGTVQTLNSLVATGTGANHITLLSSSGGSSYQLTDANGGKNMCDYLDVTDCTGSPSNTFYYGANGSGDAYSQAHGWASAIASSANFLLLFY